MQNLEVELKFALPREAVAALEAHPFLQGAAATQTIPFSTVYFDTPDRRLQKALVSCRIRDEGERRVQTVKCSTGDVLSRREWQTQTTRDAPDLSCAPLSRVLRKALADAPLEPVFRVNVERRTWVVPHGASLIEAALDRGWIYAGARSVDVCEFELELQQGEERDLFALARILCADLPLELDLCTKSQRGFALKDGGEGNGRAPSRALLKKAAFAEGFVMVAQAALAPLRGCVRALRETPEPEALHRTRTTVRRLRALLRVFARVVHDEAFDALAEELRQLSRTLGAARDLDVAGARLGLEEALRERRAEAYARVFEALAAPGYRLLLVDFAAWLSLGAWRMQKSAREAFGQVAAHEIRRRDRRLRKAATGFAALDDDARHKLRIRAKSLAYAQDMAAADGAYGKALKALLAPLGALNDARVAAALLRAFALPDSAPQDAGKLEKRALAAVSLFLKAPRPFGGA